MSENGRNEKAGLSRRGFMKASLGLGAAAGTGLLGFPNVHAKEKIVLHYVAGGVTAYQQIAERAGQDLGFNVKLERAPSIQDNMLRAVRQPESLDILDVDYSFIHTLMSKGRLKTIEAGKLKYADKLSSVFTKGTLGGRVLSRQGSDPLTNTYLKSADHREFADGPTEWMTLAPTVFNADTLGLRPDLVQRPVRHWRALLDPEFHGRTALMNIPSIGIMDAAMAIESRGDFKYGDKGNMTREEIDWTVAILIEAKKRGQFRGFWSNYEESVKLMASGEVVLQSMWSPAVTEVRQMGIPCVYQPLEEGYRGWAYGLGFSRALAGRKLDAAYEFVNWYQSGWVGAFLGRQGYYSAVPETARDFMAPYEWDYWMEGRPAAEDIKSPQGLTLEKKGAVRDGGSFENRMSRIACWNSLMKESEYLMKKWNQFIEA